MIKKTILVLLRLYKKGISPLLGNHCRFYPTCSVYAFQAVERFGVFRGIYLSAKRIFKCQPLHPGGIDLVPDKFEVNIKWIQND